MKTPLTGKLETDTIRLDSCPSCKAEKGASCRGLPPFSPRETWPHKTRLRKTAGRKLHPAWESQIKDFTRDPKVPAEVHTKTMAGISRLPMPRGVKFKPSIERILLAANYEYKRVWTGKQHHLIVKKIVTTTGIRPAVGAQGFWTTAKRFVDRVEALAIAKQAGQIKNKQYKKDELFSEELC